MTAAKPLPILIARTLETLVAKQSARGGRGGRGGRFHASLNNQDEGLDDTLAAEKRKKDMHVHKESPSQRKGVVMKTSDCHPSSKTGVRLELI